MVARRSGALLVARAAAHADRRALIAPDGAWTYARRCSTRRRASPRRCSTAPPTSTEARVAFLVAAELRARRDAVGHLARRRHRRPAVRHASGAGARLRDRRRAGVDRSSPTPRWQRAARAARPPQRGLRSAATTDALLDAATAAPCPTSTPTRRAMILYTSGTTSKPKGVVTTHAMLAAQIALGGRGVGVDGGRPHPARAAAASPARHPQPALLPRCGSGPRCEMQPASTPTRSGRASPPATA